MKELFYTGCALTGIILGWLVLMIPAPEARLLLSGVVVLPPIVGALATRRRAGAGQ